MLGNEIDDFFYFKISFAGTPRAFALDVEAALVECPLKVDASISTCKRKNMYQPPCDSLSGNCFMRTNSTKQQLIFPICNVLGSLNIQINVMAGTQIFSDVKLRYFISGLTLFFLAVFVTFEKWKFYAELCQIK